MKLFKHFDRLIIDKKEKRIFLFFHTNLKEVLFNDGDHPFVFTYEDGYIHSPIVYTYEDGYIQPAKDILLKSEFKNAYIKAGETDEEDRIVYLKTLDNDEPQPFVRAEWSDYKPYLRLDIYNSDYRRRRLKELSGLDFNSVNRTYFTSSPEIVKGVCYLADSCVCLGKRFHNFYKFVATDGREFYIRESYEYENDNINSRFKFIIKEEFEVYDSKTAYNEMISEMNGKGFEMKQSNGGYFCCIHKDKDGIERPVWANTMLEYAYNLEMATAFAYGKCKVWEAEHPFLFIDCPAEDEDENSDTNVDEINFDNYFSPLQYLNIGYYVHNMISIDELAAHLSLPTSVVKNIVSEIKLKPRILKGNDYEFGVVMKDFAKKVEKVKLQSNQL